MFDVLKVVILVMELTRILAMLLYFKYPQLMRGVMVIDIIIRVLSSFFPMELVGMKRIFFIDIAFDCITNYCGDFWANLGLINI